MATVKPGSAPRYEIVASEGAVTIGIEGVVGRQEALLTAFGECQDGHCSCPTDEYTKVSTMEVRSSPDRIQIELRSKPGAEIDPEAIAACLDHTVEKTTLEKTPAEG